MSLQHPSKNVQTRPFAAETSENDAQILYIVSQIALDWHSQIVSLKTKRNSDSLFKMRWMNVTYVCRHRHTLTLAAHALWSVINLDSDKPRIVGQVKRSGLAALIVKMFFPTSSEPFQTILGNSERIRALRITGQARRIHALLAMLPTHNLPILSSIHLISHPSGERPNDFVAVLPTELLEGRLLALRELTLRSVNFAWRSLRGIETLCHTQYNDCPRAAADVRLTARHVRSVPPSEIVTTRLNYPSGPPRPLRSHRKSRKEKMGMRMVAA
ncbi:hypothetical protein DFH09DRAFT_1288358 [Mycena vulgaris]|nr:hypothetical protein DFH09DRAFT_1288358 [Mycena vulgaris]